MPPRCWRRYSCGRPHAVQNASMADQRANKRDLVALEGRIDGKLESLRGALQEATQDSETRILRAIYGYTETLTERVFDVPPAT